jgi:hypothetical protein
MVFHVRSPISLCITIFLSLSFSFELPFCDARSVYPDSEEISKILHQGTSDAKKKTTVVDEDIDGVPIDELPSRPRFGL